MVELMNSSKIGSESNTLRVKLEIEEDWLDEEDGTLNKKSKLSSCFDQMWNTGSSSCWNPLDEPSPLGLRLRKSPSLMDLIQMRLSQGKGGGDLDPDFFAVSNATDKLKASNFPASLLRIGAWEYVSRYEGDLVAKCYYAKHKLVWEVLEGGLKSKLELQWSDITSLKANYSEDSPGTLDIVLARQPLFFRETNPQPRKHTLWQASPDFTGGQASVNRRHFLQCPQGLLSKHFEKLIQCDPRLKLLSRQPEIILDSPYFEPKGSLFEDPDESKCNGFDQLKSDYVSTFSGFREAPSPATTLSSSAKSELLDPIDRASEHVSRKTPSLSSGMDTEEIGSSEVEESKALDHWDRFKVSGLHVSMSMSDLVNHIGHCISEQMTSGNPLLDEGLQSGDMLEEITQYLLSDSQLASTSDEKSLMSRVNSLCCLLQKNPTSVQNLQVNNDCTDDHKEEQHEYAPDLTLGNHVTGGGLMEPEKEPCDAPECKQTPFMSRKDSVGDLLLHLPRIASLPQFLFNI